MDVALDAGDRAADLAAIFSDPVAFRRWYDVAVVRVYSYLLGRCGGDVTLAEDLTQQAFIQAVRRRETFDGRSDPITWVIAIARNKLADHHRELDRQERRHLRLLVREVAVLDEPGTGHVEDRDAVLMALRNLPALQRSALVLRYVDDLSVRDVARALGRTEDAVESLIRRAKDAFRTAYGDVDDG
jgi:RNA polymerase sigma-70 factor, ECF subfamily